MTELWLVDLERTAPALQVLEAAQPRLSTDDRRRARQVADLRERRRRLTAYVALRVALERMAGRPLRGAAFVRSPAGKPSLAGVAAEFSLSHSGRFALIGVTRLAAIGVDLERARSVRMSPRHQQLLAAAGRALADMPLPAQSSGDAVGQETFLQAWSRLEAFAKARGQGLARLLADVGVRGGSHAATPAQIETATRRVAREAGLKVCDLRLPAGLFGAVAVAKAAPFPRVRAFPIDGPAVARLIHSRRRPRQ
jgi:phosphopantetheinyl transferase